MRLYPHINFSGKCEEAFQFYERCLDGRIATMLKWGDSPMVEQVPAEWRQKICHANLMVGEDQIAGVDDPFDPVERPAGFQVLLEVESVERAERIFQALADGGEVRFGPHKTFWAAYFGVVVDRFGVRWEVSCAG